MTTICSGTSCIFNKFLSVQINLWINTSPLLMHVISWVDRCAQSICSLAVPVFGGSLRKHRAGEWIFIFISLYSDYNLFILVNTLHNKIVNKCTAGKIFSTVMQSLQNVIVTFSSRSTNHMHWRRQSLDM